MNGKKSSEEALESAARLGERRKYKLEKGSSSLWRSR